MLMIFKLQFSVAEHVGTLSLSVGHHQVLKPILSGLKESRGSWRHINQNSSILYNMEQTGILKKGDGSTYIEFGSGRGFHHEKL